MTSEYTKTYRLKLWLYRVLDFICLFFPLAFYIFMALGGDGVTSVGKVSIVGTVTIAMILCIFNVIAQKRLRCPIWICLIGLYIAMKDQLMPLIIILAVTTVLDDLVFTPIIQYYRTKLTASKAIDEREQDQAVSD